MCRGEGQRLQEGRGMKKAMSEKMVGEKGFDSGKGIRIMITDRQIGTHRWRKTDGEGSPCGHELGIISCI